MLIEKITSQPVTHDILARAFQSLGIKAGMDLVVHSALKGMGYIVNGPHDVISALEYCVGPSGTILMPAHSGQVTDPADWTSPAIPAEWLETVRANLRPFDKKTTEIRNRGILTQAFFNYPGVERSDHPVKSVMARGARAKYYTANHPLHESEGVDSPAGRFYEQGGYVLLIGVRIFNGLTFIHLSEFMEDSLSLRHGRVKALVVENGDRKFVPLKKFPWSSKGFSKLDDEMDARGIGTKVQIGECVLWLFPFRDAIDIAREFMKDDPSYWYSER